MNNLKYDVADFLSKDLVILSLIAQTKEGVLKELVDYLSEKYPQIKKKILLEDLNRREQSCTTGIGNAIAIPHAITTATDTLYILIARAEGIDYDSFDGRAVQLIFLFVIPQAMQHVYKQLLQSMCIMLREPELRTQLLEAKTAEKIIELLTKK